jgi:acylphosphatase
MKSTIVRINGRVQGVWFRAWTEKQAVALGLDGWVRNRDDGSVEALFSGDDAKVDQMIAACHDGPPASRVEDVLVVPGAEKPRPGFNVRKDH